MARTHIRTVVLRKWFPPRDRLAASMARLSILREDLYIDLMGIYQPEIASLDENSVFWRKMFFWRSLTKTIWEMRKTFESLNTIPEFKKILKAQPLKWQQQFADMTKLLEKHMKVLEATRNALGGHVLSREVERALDGMPSDTFGFLEVGETEKGMHYRFANDLVCEMFVIGVDEDKRPAEFEKHFRAVADLFPVFTLTGILVVIYAKARGLLH